MARTRTTIRRVDPWSVLKFAFVANLVLLGVYLLVGAVAWAFVRRLQLIDTLCELALNVGFRECAVDGQALFDTMLVLGLLGVVIQTGVFVFLAFLANLIFDLIGGIAVTLDDDAPSRGSEGALARVRRGVGTTIGSSRTDRTRGSPTDDASGPSSGATAGASRSPSGTRSSSPSSGAVTRGHPPGGAPRPSGARGTGQDQTGVLSPTVSQPSGAGRPSGRGSGGSGTGRPASTSGSDTSAKRTRGGASSDDDRLFGDG